MGGVVAYTAVLAEKKGFFLKNSLDCRKTEVCSISIPTAKELTCDLYQFLINDLCAFTGKCV